MQRIKSASLRSAKLRLQLRATIIGAPHVHVPGVAVVDAIVTSTSQREQRKIVASQEIVVTTTALALRVVTRRSAFLDRRYGGSAAR